jgi:hypothetical protein
VYSHIVHWCIPYLQEPLLTGTYFKCNDNCGGVDYRPGQIKPVLQMFSHWSYEVTGHRLLVVDLQVYHGIFKCTQYATPRLRNQR